MSNQSYWDWAKHVPPGWSVPEELLGPTKISNINLVIKMLESEIVGNDVVELIGRVLTEVARFNVWFAKDIDGKVSAEVQAALYAKYRDITKTIYDAWKSYEIASATPVGDDEDNEIESEHRDLLNALQNVTHELSEARNDGQFKGS